MAQKKEVRRERLYYMYYNYNGRQVRSKEYVGLVAFTAACGKWCDENPGCFRLCWRDRYTDNPM